MYSNLQALDDPRVQEVIQEHILFLVVIYKKKNNGFTSGVVIFVEE